jgi:hypothetical protein
MRRRSPLPALLLVAVACGGSESDGAAATSGAAGSSSDGSTAPPTSVGESTGTTGGEGTEGASSSSGSSADPSTGVADGSSSSSGDTTGVADASSSETGVTPWCVDHCACMATTCAEFEGYPWADADECESDCATWGDAEAACFPMWCTMAAKAGASAAHLCEHGWNAFGLDEC